MLTFSTFSFLFKGASSITDDDIKLSERLYIPGRKLRGFESGKIGPKEGNEYIGGNYGSAINLNTTLPNVLSGYENIDVWSHEWKKVNIINQQKIQ